MKRLLTYGLLLLTILASHFVVSACQDDLPETTEVMMTFTTRAVTQGAASTAPDKERMKDLHVIMLRSDGTIVGNHTEPNITASSVTFTFSTPIKTTGEDFTFLAIANENNIGKTLVNGNLEIGDKLSTGDIEELTMNANLNAIDALPQTKLWTVHVPQTQNHHVNQQLDFVASKISVQFVNETGEEQSLSDIKLTGMPQATAGYLFKQTDNDFVTPLQDASDIAFTNVTMETGATSAEQAYYTYPVAAISEAALVATWNGKPYELPLDGITRLARNDHLRIEITLTPAQDITVNYTIAEWKDNNTNIGGEAPTTPGNGYHVDPWGENSNIEIGGGGNEWDLGNGEKIEGEKEWTYEIGGQNPEISDRISVHLPEDILVLGNKIILYFYCHTPNGDIPKNGIIIQFKNSEDTVLKESVAEEDISYAWDETKTIRYVRYLTFNADVLSKLKKAWNSPEGTKALIVKPVNPDNTQQAVQIQIDQLVVIRPLND